MHIPYQKYCTVQTGYETCSKTCSPTCSTVASPSNPRTTLGNSIRNSAAPRHPADQGLLSPMTNAPNRSCIRMRRSRRRHPPPLHQALYYAVSPPKAAHDPTSNAARSASCSPWPQASRYRIRRSTRQAGPAVTADSRRFWFQRKKAFIVVRVHAHLGSFPVQLPTVSLLPGLNLLFSLPSKSATNPPSKYIPRPRYLLRPQVVHVERDSVVFVHVTVRVLRVPVDVVD